MTTLLKVAFPLAKKIQNDPKIIEHLVQQAGDLVTNLIPPTPPPRLLTTLVTSAIPVSEPVKSNYVGYLKEKCKKVHTMESDT